MKKEELFDLLAQAEVCSLRKIPMNMVKPRGWKLKGYKVRTPFGLCEVGNFREYEDRVEILIFVETEKALKFYRNWPESPAERSDR